ncbi:MAG TPA: GNAT family N-acetyltransferase [Terriglobales bacterium]|nr:GNAT family N-acetyltransferase [Terriglobales bacterium]
MSQQPQKQLVTAGRFEIEENGAIAYLEYRESPGVLELIHTEVPEELRHKGLATALAETALGYARDHNLKIDIICPIVSAYIRKHPEYSDLVLR